MPANIRSTFRIIVDETLQGGTAAANATVTNPGRAFRVVGVYVTGADTAALTLQKNGALGTTVSTTTLATGDLNDFPSALAGLTPAILTFNSTDDLFLSETAGLAAVTRVVVECEAASPQDLPVT